VSQCCDEVFFCAEPGEFEFEEPHYYGDKRSGVVTAYVHRQKGCDGTVKIEYSTM